MLVSFNWLKDYLNLPDSITAEEVGAKLKASTVEVEGVNNLGKDLKDIVVGKVVSCDKHPNADKLKLCQVDVDNERLQIVCGGSNVRADMLVALAKIGAKVRWHGEGDLIELAPTAIRGVESFGMICAGSEIGLSDMFPSQEEKEILDLSNYNFAPGTELAKALNLNDSVLEIDNKSLSNRPDLWGHYGLAREVAVLLNKELAEYKTAEIKSGKDLKLKVNVVDSKLCPRYMAVAVKGVEVGPSPDWLKKKLLAVGINSINNVVDITNYVMFDLGQPLHAFDANLLAGAVAEKEISVRLASAGEEFKALDGNTYKLSNEDLVIADSAKPIAVAGVIGGENSAIVDSTNVVIFEAANFDATNIRKTSTRLNVRTDSAQRFEKSLDPNLCEFALKKAVEMLLQLCPQAEVVSKIVDEASFSLPVGPIEIDKNIFYQKIGVEISEKEIIKILEKLGFELKDKKEYWSVKIPTWRATKDVSLAEDLVEEVLRIYGYEQIPAILPNFPIVPPEANKLRGLERKISDILVKEFACTESYNYSFVSAEQIKNLGEDQESYIELDNPLAKDRPFLRRHLLTNLLTNIANNINQVPEVKIFEIGKVFRNNKSGIRATANGDELLPRQDVWLTVVYTNKKDQNPFWEMRRMMESVGSEIGLDWETTLEKDMPLRDHPTRTAIIKSGEVVGVMGEVSKVVTENFGIDYRVGFLQINLNDLVEFGQFIESGYKSVSEFPAVERDVAFLVDKNVEHATIIKVLKEVDGLITEVKLFDVYTGSNIADDKKSMAYRIVYSDPKRTLTGAEVDKIQEKVISLLQKKFSAEIR